MTLHTHSSPLGVATIRAAIAALIVAILGIWILLQGHNILLSLFSILALLLLSLFVLKLQLRWIVLGLIVLSGFQADYPIYETSYMPLGSTAFGRVLTVDIGILLYFWRRLSLPQSSESQADYGRIRNLQITYIFLALIVWEAVSLLTAEYLDAGFFQILSSLRVFAVMLIIIDFARDEPSIRWVLKGLLLVYVINIFFTGIQLINGGPLGLSFIGETQLNFRASVEIDGVIEQVFVSGFVGGPYSLAGYLVLIIPLIFSFLLVPWFIPRWVTSILLGSGLLLLVLTGSRGAMLALAGGISCMILVLILRGRHRLWLRATVGISVALLPVVVIFGEQIYRRFFVSNTFDSVNTRLQLIQAALQLVARNPIWGVGIANFSPIVAGTDQLFGNAGRPAHNVELLWMAETGIIGMLLLMSCWLWALVVSLKLTGQTMPVVHLRFLALGLLGGIVGLIIHAQTDIIYRQAVIFIHYGIYLGLIGSLVLYARERRKNATLQQMTDPTGRLLPQTGRHIFLSK